MLFTNRPITEKPNTATSPLIFNRHDHYATNESKDRMVSSVTYIMYFRIFGLLYRRKDPEEMCIPKHRIVFKTTGRNRNSITQLCSSEDHFGTNLETSEKKTI